MGRFNQCFLNDDDNDNWTIETPEHSYGFTYWQNQWIMTDENGNTVDSFPPFSTLEEDEATADDYEIHDDGADSSRVIGKVAGGTENALDGAQTRQRVQTTESLASETEDDSVHSGASPLPIVGVIGAVAVIDGVGFYMTKRRK